MFLSVVRTELPFPGEADPYKEAQILKKELPRNGNFDDSAHDGNLLDNVIDTDTDEVAKLRMAPSILIICWLG